jgi:hypothetical protein
LLVCNPRVVQLEHSQVKVLALCPYHPRDLIDELGAHSVIAEVHLMQILVQRLNELSTTLIINSIISEIDLPYSFRYF